MFKLLNGFISLKTFKLSEIGREYVWENERVWSVDL